MTVVKAAPRQAVYMLWAGYGTISGARSYPRGRLWLLTTSVEPDADVICRIAWNHPSTGRVEYEDLGSVAKATTRGQRSAEVYLASNEVVTFVTAPCVCGAGAVGNALPAPGRVSLQYVNPNGRARLTVL
jgi:hypothetical protein